MHTIYIKTHINTKKQYIGYHNIQKGSIETYKGSGKYWKRHIKKHGYNVLTEVLATFSTEDFALEAEQYYISLAGAITWNKGVFCNIHRGGRLGQKEISKYRRFRYTTIDPRKGKTWETIYGVKEAEIKRQKQSIEKRGKKMAPYRKREYKDYKKGRSLIEIYGYNKYVNPPKSFTVKFSYPDKITGISTFRHEQDFFDQTKLETTTLSLLKKYKVKIIKRITSKTQHIYPKGTILEIIS